jgi:four helix bundle protein
MKIEIRRISSSFPSHERFELTSQIRRSKDSISSNLAEGSGRASNFDQAHFTNMAYSTALETIDHLNTAIDMQYISLEMYEGLRIKLDEIINKLNALYKFQITNQDTLKKRF